MSSDELDQIDSRREYLAGRLQELYGYLRREAEDEIDEFMDISRVQMGM